MECQARRDGKKRRSWLCMEFLHKGMFVVRLQLDALYEMERETPRNNVGRKKKIGQF